MTCIDYKKNRVYKYIDDSGNFTNKINFLILKKWKSRPQLKKDVKIVKSSDEEEKSMLFVRIRNINNAKAKLKNIFLANFVALFGFYLNFT